MTQKYKMLIFIDDSEFFNSLHAKIKDLKKEKNQNAMKLLKYWQNKDT